MISLLMHRKFLYPNISGSLKGLRTKFFRTVRPKKSKWNRDTPLLSIKVFDVQDSETKRDSLPSFIGSIREKN